MKVCSAFLMWWRGCGLAVLLQEVHSEYQTLTRTNKSFTHDNFISKMGFFTRDLVTLFSWEKELAYDVYLLQVLRKTTARTIGFPPSASAVSMRSSTFHVCSQSVCWRANCEAGRHNRKGTVKYPAATCDAEQNNSGFIRFDLWETVNGSLKRAK